MERNGQRGGGASSAHKNTREKGSSVVCQSHSPATKRDGAVCAVSTKIGRGKTRTRRQARHKRTSGKIGRQKTGRGKGAHSRWKQDPEQTGRVHSCFATRDESTGGLPCIPSVTEKYFYPHKRKG